MPGCVVLLAFVPVCWCQDSDANVYLLLPLPACTCRGRVMNRAARIAEKAGSGQVWCSAAVWSGAGGYESMSALCIEGNALGQLNFKGVTEPVDVVHARTALRGLQPAARVATAGLPSTAASHSGVMPSRLLSQNLQDSVQGSARSSMTAAPARAMLLNPATSGWSGPSLLAPVHTAGAAAAHSGRVEGSPGQEQASLGRKSSPTTLGQVAGTAAGSEHTASGPQHGPGMHTGPELQPSGAGQLGCPADVSQGQLGGQCMSPPYAPSSRASPFAYAAAAAAAASASGVSAALMQGPSQSFRSQTAHTGLPAFHSTQVPAPAAASLLQRMVSTVQRTGSAAKPMLTAASITAARRRSGLGAMVLGDVTHVGQPWWEEADGEGAAEQGRQLPPAVATFQGMQL